MKRFFYITSIVALLAVVGCAGPECKPGMFGSRGGKHKAYPGPQVDRPFPLGQVTDAHWQTQQTNAEAADFIFFDHEFKYDTLRHVDTAELGPAAKKHLQMVALRLEHVPFPVVIEESQHNARPELDQQRRRTVVEQLNRLGVQNADERVVVAGKFAEGFTSIEAERSFSNIIGGGLNGNGGGGGGGRRFGGGGGSYR